MAKTQCKFVEESYEDSYNYVLQTLRHRGSIRISKEHYTDNDILAMAELEKQGYADIINQDDNRICYALDKLLSKDNIQALLK